MRRGGWGSAEKLACQVGTALTCALVGVVAPRPARAADVLGVGLGVGVLRWTSALEAARFLSVSSDSIWMWPVEANANLTTGLLKRGGQAVVLRGELQEIDTEAGTALVDGDGTTAYDPDEASDAERTDPVFVDLGGTFRINRIRLYPRLDRAHTRRFLQEFAVQIGDGPAPTEATEGHLYPLQELFQYKAPNHNTEPVVDRRFDSMSARTVAIVPTSTREWELAEVEVYGDGTAPVGEYVSVPLSARRSTPVWGRVMVNGEDPSGGAFLVQTRTGPDANPLLYHMKKGDELIPVSKAAWEGAEPGLQGPVLPNPEWSSWETVDEGMVRSPSLNRFLQFRLRLPEPGVSIRSLAFEYTFPPIAHALLAEIHPHTVTAGEETEFTLSLVAHLSLQGSSQRQDTGFRQLEVLADAQIGEVERVLVDDEEVFFTVTPMPERGFSLNLWRRVVQDGSFVQVIFRAALFRDRSRFEVRALDRRVSEDGELEVAYQLASEADVDEALEGSGLVVRLTSEEGELPVLGAVRARANVVTPNGDGVNDRYELSVDVLKLVAPATMTLDIVRLDGQRVRRAHEGAGDSGSYELWWDGRDEAGETVPPGLYLYELRVEADSGPERRIGTLGVAY